MPWAWIAKIISNWNEMEICCQLSPPCFFAFVHHSKCQRKKTHTPSHSCLDYASIHHSSAKNLQRKYTPTHQMFMLFPALPLLVIQAWAKTHDIRQNSHDLRFRSFEFYHVIFSFRKIWLRIFRFVMPFVQTQGSDLEVWLVYG